MLPKTHVQSRLHAACFTALAAAAGLNANELAQDQGVDFNVRAYRNIGGQRIPVGLVVPIQLKATTRWQRKNGKNGYISIDLKVEDYNKLAQSTPPTILVVMLLPQEHDQWTDFTLQHTLIRHCCYWSIIKETVSKNQSSVRVHIPESNFLTPAALLDIANRYPDI